MNLNKKRIFYIRLEHIMKDKLDKSLFRTTQELDKKDKNKDKKQILINFPHFQQAF